MSEHNISVEGGTSVRLLTAGKYCDRDIVVTAMANTSESEEHEILVKLIERTITEFDVPKEVTKIGASAFNACAVLKTVKIHDGVTSIKSYAFNSCMNLKLEEIPAGVTEIQPSAFVACRGLTKLTFKGTPTTIGEDAFRGCTNLVTINVPWAEGEVANAPWGATNATINYNYTGA